jgi:CubicO group peptidase (beta-lactamase class C family)
MFTAVLTLKAVEENRIDLDRPIDRFFPEIKNASNISIGQLMNHRSGIHSFTSNPDYLAWNEQAKSKEELLKIINDGGSDFEPGTKAEYSNSNYVLLTWILEDIYKQDYAQLVKQYIADPLNLRDTYVGQSISIEDKEVNSYKYLGGWKKSGETHMSIPLGDGAMVYSTADLAIYIEGLFG